MIEAYFSGLSLDHKFQDWMVEKRLFTRSSDSEDKLRERFGNPHLKRGERELWEILLKKHGYIMGEVEIAEDWAQIRDVDKVPTFDTMDQYIPSLRRKAKDPTVIFNIRGLGYSVGIEGCVMAYTGIYLLSRLWRYSEHWLPQEELNRWLYGEDSENNNKIKQQISSLNRLLIPKNIIIQNSRSSYEDSTDIPFELGFYRLHEEPQEKQLKMAV